MFWNVGINRARAIAPAATGATRVAAARGIQRPMQVPARVTQPAKLQAPKYMLRAPQRPHAGVPRVDRGAQVPAKGLPAMQWEIAKNSPAPAWYGTGTFGALPFADNKLILGAVAIVALAAGAYFLKRGLA